MSPFQKKRPEWPWAQVLEGMILGQDGEILDCIQHLKLDEAAVGPWELQVLSLPKGRPTFIVHRLTVSEARGADPELYPDLVKLLTELDGRVEGRRHFLVRLAGGDFEVSRRVATSREYSPNGKDFGGLWQSTGGQYQYFVNGVSGLGPILDKDECRGKVIARAQEMLTEFDRLVAADEVEAALNLAASL